MAERDVFESRLRAALLRQVADGPTEFDALEFAREVAAREPRRQGLRGLTGTLAWRSFAVPRVAWVLLLLALLTAMIGGTLLVGSRLEQKLPAVIPPIGEAYTCPAGSNPDQPGLAGQARPPLAYVMPMAFDRRAGRIVLLTEGGPPTESQTWTFDVCTNTWAQMDPATNVRASQVVYDVDSDLTIAVSPSRGVWAYDLKADTWTERSPAPVARMTRQPRLAYDSASGLVLMLASTADAESEPAELWSYDVDTDTWTRLPQKGAVPDVQIAHEGVLAYDPSIDRIVLYDRVSVATRIFDPRTFEWSVADTETPDISFGWGASGGEIAYDEAAGRIVVASYGRVVAYDGRQGGWEILEPGFVPGDWSDPGACGPVCRWRSWMVYDPVNRRLVVYGGESVGPWVQSDDVLAFEPATRQWTTLLPALAAP